MITRKLVLVVGISFASLLGMSTSSQAAVMYCIQYMLAELPVENGTRYLYAADKYFGENCTETSQLYLLCNDDFTDTGVMFCNDAPAPFCSADYPIPSGCEIFDPSSKISAK